MGAHRKVTRQTKLSIGALSQTAGVDIENIRYFERIGMMPAPPRSSGGHRVYGQDHLKRLTFIRRSRELGFTPDEVRALLSLVDSGSYTCGEVHQITLEHLQSVRQKIADLRRLECTLTRISNECSGDTVPECPVIDALSAG
jgi:MerR family mercuric resistance operon transcriptional regulator